MFARILCFRAFQSTVVGLSKEITTDGVKPDHVGKCFQCPCGRERRHFMSFLISYHWKPGEKLENLKMNENLGYD